MKKALVIILAILNFSAIAYGQINLYGITKGNDPKIIKYNVSGDVLSVEHQFQGQTTPWYNSLIQAKDGKLYGMAKSGGANGYGVLFSFDPVTRNYQALHHFDGTNGRSPYGSLVQASNGKLYGLTEGGGTNNMGTVFSFDIAAYSFTKLHDFDGTNGRSPYGSLVQASDGTLYGMTQFGGTNKYGTIFSVNPGSQVISANKHSFNWTDGAWPNSSLVESNGKLYGMTESGGINYGVTFEFNPANSLITRVENFTNANGRTPYGALLKASTGELFGMTYRGGLNDLGVIFSFNPATFSSSKLKDFDGVNGAYPAAALLETRLLNNIPLPLKILSFNVNVEDRKVEVELIVDQEYDIVKYEVQRSEDGINFTPIAFANAKNEHKKTQYVFYDGQPLSTNYYRIKIHEQNSASQFTAIKKVELGKREFMVQLKVNPVVNDISVLLRLPEKEQLAFRLIDIQGRLVKDWGNKIIESGEHHLQLQIDNLQQGTYLLEVKSLHQQRILKLIK